jgi:hypothetical protein
MNHAQGYAQGLPWVNFYNRIGPEGAVRVLRGFCSDRSGGMLAPSGPNALFWLSQAKAWAMLSMTLRATE